MQVTERDGELDYGFYDMTCFFYILFSVVTVVLTKRILPIKPPKRLHPHLYTKTQKRNPKELKYKKIPAPKTNKGEHIPPQNKK